MNGKGDKRRPARVDDVELERRWGQTFRPKSAAGTAPGDRSPTAAKQAVGRGGELAQVER